MLEIGLTAPEFTLPNQNNSQISLSSFKGTWVLLYFYPKDNTPGCTIEACTIRDRWSEFQRSEITVLGISADSVESHHKFTENHSLPFTLLSDPEHRVIKRYDALAEKLLFGKKFTGVLRISYLIDPQGKIRKTYPKVNPSDHAGEILKDVLNS